MRIHLFEAETNEDRSWEAEGGNSWAVCGKSIKNVNITVDDNQATCATCLKIHTKSKISEKAA